MTTLNSDEDASVNEDRVPSNQSQDFYLERYKFILQQMHAANENVYRFLAIYQTLATTLAGAALALLVGYKRWGIDPALAKSGIIGAVTLVTTVGLFVVLLIVAGVATWLDYRQEECKLTDLAVIKGFREPPRMRNFFRWYETYIILFIAVTTGLLWLAATVWLIPSVK
ncbi:hypothetical protein ACN263_12580 [Micromonospora sp. WMMD729]|uniref:hypothetical protein n=1 Tax=Micromonospora sp. WMMD729 TaxID=3404127 RepID=UPI003BF4C335